MTTPASPVHCPLCDGDGGLLVARTPLLRVVRADEAGFPAFYRVIWNAHVAELSDLTAAQRTLCLEAVVAVEQVLREHLRPTKINIASLGNLVPHLHWHVVARFDWDTHFPAPIWAAALRPAHAQRLSALTDSLALVDAAVADRLAGAGIG